MARRVICLTERASWVRDLRLCRARRHGMTMTSQPEREAMMTSNTSQRPVVVVRVDSSDESMKALTWAESYADLLGADLDIVTAWHHPTPYGVGIPMTGWDPEADAMRVVEKAAAELHRLPPERVRLTARQGAAGVVLVGHSNGAAALVVGSRGHNAFTGMVLGSVSAHCTHYA